MENPPSLELPYCSPQGFWKAYNIWVQSRMFAPVKKDIHLAALELATSLIEMTNRQATLEDLRRFGGEALVVIINIITIKKMDIWMNLEQTADYPLPSYYFLKYLSVVCATSMRHFRTESPDEHPRFCTDESTTQEMKRAIEAILRMLVSYSEGSLRDLAVDHYRRADPSAYIANRSTKTGLLYIP